LEALAINGQLTFASEISVLDISMGGISLTADRRLNIGGKYMLKLEERQNHVSVVCEVAWARMSGTKRSAEGETVPVYTAGMKFVDVSEKTSAELMSFVECIRNEEVQRANDRRTHMRFSIRAPGIAILNFPTDYKVRTISLSGMLIESDQALESESRVPMTLSLQADRTIGFLGRVVSCQKTDETGVAHYHIGIEFLELTEEAKAALATFIGALSSMDGA